MTVEASDNHIAPRDILDCLPGLHLPDLTYLGSVKYSLMYEGRPLNFRTHFTGRTMAGDINIDGKIKIDPVHTTYSGTVDVHSLALETILKSQNMPAILMQR